jgi:hypothetical protein
MQEQDSKREEGRLEGEVVKDKIGDKAYRARPYHRSGAPPYQLQQILWGRTQ